MTQQPPRSFSPQWQGSDRPGLPRTGTEREVLTACLDWHRATLEAKCAGLTAAQLSGRAAAPSTLSLHGLVRHLADVERWWLRVQFAGEDLPLPHYSEDDPDQDFDDLDGDPAEAFAVWRGEVERAREIVDRAATLDELAAAPRSGGPIQLRAILVKLVAEYARHNGHADLLRESADGAVGV
ncbi:DinB family protein [Nocardiopsis sp. EMB25]|uniref:DinB family protein n=1 Tax=Nocardiopsis sp. EMB25 TaxID=2835867 RepID=UPI0022838AB5|nr:DinB family protein [Nocardiopsis sp. EMB25]MCY9787905.1 DinB family protein [Nocardiopsis sp. EMB25]